MGRAVFPTCCWTWGQTMVEVMKIMVTSFQRSHAHTATLSASNTAAGHCCPMPLLETSGHSQASLGQSLVESLLLSTGSWCAHGFVCALQEFILPVQCKFWWLCGGVKVTSSKRAYAIPRSAAPRALPLQQATADPHLHRRYSNTVLAQSLWGHWVLLCTEFVWALQVSLLGMVFDSKCNFTPPTILLGLLCPWMWGIFPWLDPTFSCQGLFSSEL